MSEVLSNLLIGFGSFLTVFGGYMLWRSLRARP